MSYYTHWRLDPKTGKCLRCEQLPSEYDACGILENPFTNIIGPQRASPSSVSKIEAEHKRAVKDLGLHTKDNDA